MLNDALPPTVDLGLRWNHRFARLGADFHTAPRPTPLPAPYWVGRSRAVARELGLEEQWLQSQAGLEVFTGNLLPTGAEPLASVYGGHQFGVWAGQLGDGRAILLGETEGGLEIQLKGSGLTPYSRMGDGRAVLRAGIREFLGSEAMHGLGIPTSRALCVTGSDAPVQREEVETAAVLTRVAPSFIRFGHFEHFAARGLEAPLRRLADHVLERHYPACLESACFAGNRHAALLAAVSERCAAVAAQWQATGFCHGVLNTDNMSILGLTLDYGPFQFLDAYDPGHVCNHSDSTGRYAYGRQPGIVHWNLFCLGQALLPLIGRQELALAALESYPATYARELETRMRAKLGLAPGDKRPGDPALLTSILQLLERDEVDYPLFWRRLSQRVKRAATGPAPACPAISLADAAAPSDEPLHGLFRSRDAAVAWLLRFSERLKGVDIRPMADSMLKTNPKYVLRNHLAEQAIRQARHKDFSEVATLLRLLEAPFDEHPGFESRAGLPPAWARSLAVGCSS